MKASSGVVRGVAIEFSRCVKFFEKKMLLIYDVGRKETMIKFVAVILFFCFAECAAGKFLDFYIKN